jgi:glycosyltransferase involved in cell wall biosynthesis
MQPFKPLTSLSFRTVNNFASHTITPKKVLFLTYRFPYPLSGGDRLKSYHLLRHLSEISEVDLISLDEWGTATHENLQHIKKFASTVTVVPFNKTAAAKRAALSLLTKTPAEIAWYYSPQMQEVVDIALASKRYDLVICFFIRTGSYLTSGTFKSETPKILIAEDSRLLADERASEKFSFSSEYFIRKTDARKLHAYEPEMMRQFEVTTFVAKPDQERLLREDANLKTAILSNGVDTAEYVFYEGEKENSLLFAGHLGIFHNKVMAERILTKIFPKIRERSPQTKLIIAGKDPDESLQKLIKNTPGAELHANVAEMRPYYQKASLFIHPQDKGAGIQNKLLESMAMGTPVITTALGASGITGITNHLHLVVSETDDEFVTSILSLLADKEECLRLARNARKLITERYTWDKIFDNFDKIITGILPNFFIAPKRISSPESQNGSR